MERTDRLRHCYALENRNTAVRLQQPIDGLKVKRQVLPTNGFQHFNADDFVV